jgi:hypothetical protein
LLFHLLRSILSRTCFWKSCVVVYLKYQWAGTVQFNNIVWIHIQFSSFLFHNILYICIYTYVYIPIYIYIHVYVHIYIDLHISIYIISSYLFIIKIWTYEHFTCEIHIIWEMPFYVHTNQVFCREYMKNIITWSCKIFMYCNS